MADEKVKVSSLVTVAPKTTDKVLITTTDDSGQLQTRNALVSDIRNLAASLEDSEDKAINVKIANKIVKKVTDLAGEVDTSFETVNQNFTNVNNAISKNRDNITTANENMTAHEEDTDLHVTAEKQQKWDGYDQSIKDVKEIADNNTTQLKDLANLNLFINGGFSVWQRGTSFSTNGYTADRWMYDVEGDDKGKIVRHANGGVQIKLISNKRFLFMQRIELNQELKNIFSNSTVTLSFYVTTSAGVKISPYIRVWSPSRNANIFLKSYEAKATRQLIECQITLGDLSSDDWLGIDIFRIEEDNKFTVGDDLYIRFENAKLELGTKATPFVPRPYGEELALCQRYYISDSFSFRESVPTTTVWDKFIPIRPYMRIVPTINASMYNTNDQNTLLDNIKFSVYRGNNLNFWSDIQMLEAGVQYSVYYSLDAEIY